MAYGFYGKRAKLVHFKIKDYHQPLGSKYSRWRKIGQKSLSPGAQIRLEWLIFYNTVGKKNASLTASYFNTSRKTLHKWLKRFKETSLTTLENHSRRPHRTRQWEVDRKQERRIIELRKKYLKYGKVKLKVLYQKRYQEKISTWKIERVIRRYQLYPDYQEHEKKLKRLKRRQNKQKARINELKKNGFNPQPGKLWHTDTIILWWYGRRRVIFTAIEDKTKLGLARAYASGSSRQAKDFLKRLVYLSNSEIKIIHSDNGSEFAGEFEKACLELGIKQIYSRVRTPKDNPALERFNWTVQDEWLALSELGLDDIQEANQDLTEWLLEYNFNRPHQSLDYLTPIEYANKHYFKVLPMSPASTLAWQ